jgi:hypothetical protein
MPRSASGTEGRVQIGEKPPGPEGKELRGSSSAHPRLSIRLSSASLPCSRHRRLRPYGPLVQMTVSSVRRHRHRHGHQCRPHLLEALARTTESPVHHRHRRLRSALEPPVRAEESPVRRHRLYVGPGLRKGNAWRTGRFSAGSKGAVRSRCRAMPTDTNGPTRESDRANVMLRAVEPPSQTRAPSSSTSGAIRANGHTIVLSRDVEKRSYNRLI